MRIISGRLYIFLNEGLRKSQNISKIVNPTRVWHLFYKEEIFEESQQRINDSRIFLSLAIILRKQLTLPFSTTDKEFSSLLSSVAFGSTNGFGCQACNSWKQRWKENY